MTKRLVLLNGPPSSGKDLSAIIIRNMLVGKVDKQAVPIRTEVLKFADPIKQAAHALYCIPQSADYFEKEFGNEWKNKEAVEFYGRTPRSVYIELGEQFMKERHDASVFGRLAVRRIKLSKDNFFIIPDAGFVDEVSPLVTMFGIDNVLLIELERTGCSFDNDSRNYIAAQLNERFNGGIKHLRIKNNQDQKLLTMLLKGAMSNFIGIEFSF